MSHPSLFDAPGPIGQPKNIVRTPAAFDAPSVPVNTSEAAASSIASAAATLREKVLLHVAGCGDQGATCEEVCTALQLDGNTVRPRLWELEARVLVVKSSATRPTTSGRAARVYLATANGKAAAA